MGTNPVTLMSDIRKTHILYRIAIYLVNSLFHFQPTSETYKIGFWMRKYSSLSWKRTWVWSCTPLIRALDLGPLTEHERLTSRPTTTRYKDAKGKTRFKGNKHLKLSQYLVCISRHDSLLDLKLDAHVFFKLGSTVPAVFQAIHLQVRRETYQTCWGSPEAKGSPAD